MMGHEGITAQEGLCKGISCETPIIHFVSSMKHGVIFMYRY